MGLAEPHIIRHGSEKVKTYSMILKMFLLNFLYHAEIKSAIKQNK